MNLTESDTNRFWAMVDRKDDAQCWNWNGYVTIPGGYGRFQLNHKPVYSHRVAYAIANGAIPPGMMVCHSCDNPCCCNPSHLWIGTQAENIKDRDSKGHTPRLNGHNNAAAKLTSSQVQEIRSRFVTEEITQRQLAREYGIGNAQLNRIVHGSRWTWLSKMETTR